MHLFVLIFVFGAIMSWLFAKCAEVLTDDEIFGLDRVPRTEEGIILLVHIYRFWLADLFEHNMVACLIAVIEALFDLINLIQSFS